MLPSDSHDVTHPGLGRRLLFRQVLIRAMLVPAPPAAKLLLRECLVEYLDVTASCYDTAYTPGSTHEVAARSRSAHDPTALGARCPAIVRRLNSFLALCRLCAAP